MIDVLIHPRSAVGWAPGLPLLWKYRPVQRIDKTPLNKATYRR
jgi:hypothetical protein